MDELTWQQRYEQLAAFMNIAAHELRTPITAGKIYLQLLEEQLKDKVSDQEQRSIQRSAAIMLRLNDLVTNMLDVSRIFTGKLSVDIQEVDLVPIVTKAVASFPVQHIQVDRPATAMVKADPDRVLQVLKNIIDNSIRYASGTNNITLALTETSSSFSIVITDQGNGISAEALQNIFALRTSKEKPGLGAGLFVSKAIMEMMQGDIIVSSEQGRGTVVTLVFVRA